MESIILRHKNIFLTIIYFLAHGFLLIASGYWWDDWCIYGLSIDEFYEWINQMGRPDLIYCYYIYNFLPSDAYKIITFLMFYVSVFCFGYIIRRVFGVDGKKFFFICALYATLPVNDCRIIWSVFPYTIGFFLYMVSFVYFIYMFSNKKIPIWGRILNLLLFALSFTLNSNLVYYALVLFMIWYYERDKGVVGIFRRNIDYILLPVLFVLIKLVLYTPYGAYAGYNSVSFRSVLEALVLLLPADMYVLSNIIHNYLPISDRAFACVFSLMSIALVYNYRRNLFTCCKIKKLLSINKDANEVEKIDIMKMIICGMFILSMGLWAYVMVRRDFCIDTVGLSGRDAILVAPGGTLLIYGILRKSFTRHIFAYVTTLLVLCGIIHFNEYYLDYQWDYYKQIGFQNQLTNHPELKEKSDLLYVNEDERKINISSVYVLNTNAELVYGNQERFIRNIGTQNNLNPKNIDKFVDNPVYHMSGYDASNMEIDAILFYKFDATTKNVLTMKYYEYFKPELFKQEINKHSKMQIIDDSSTIESYMDFCRNNKH